MKNFNPFFRERLVENFKTVISAFKDYNVLQYYLAFKDYNELHLM